MKNYIKLYDLIGFKICWILCAFCSVWGKPYLGPLAALIFIIGHLSIVKFNFRDIKIIFIAILLGFILDTLFLSFGFVGYKGSISYAPLWIIAMWAGFSITLIYTLDKLQNKYFLASLLGLVGGPLSYQAGVGIGSITITNNTSYMILAIAWAFSVPLLLSLIKYFSNNQ